MENSDQESTDVLVLGSHPCAYLAAELLRQNSALSVRVLSEAHATNESAGARPPGRRTAASQPAAPQGGDDRLVHLNPAFFNLHPSLNALAKRGAVEFASAFGLRCLSDDEGVHGEFVSKSAVMCVCAMSELRRALARRAVDAGVTQVSAESVEVMRVDESGVDVQLDGLHGTAGGSGSSIRLRSRLLVVATELSAGSKRVLGIAPSWETGVLHRYTYLQYPSAQLAQPLTAKPLVPMSLDLNGNLTWAWMLPGPGGQIVQLAVEQPLEVSGNGSVGGTSPAGTKPPMPNSTRRATPSAEGSAPADSASQALLAHWLRVLARHGVLRADALPDVAQARSIDLPFAGALAHEDVANRTLLIGPAGGFCSACAEDVYPACWSAVFAADAATRALKATHLQDALQTHRQKWGATLGDYLRGPQQNLRFLLPLVYRNKVMTARLAEAILFGKSVVR